ncbi:MAG: hypothetical protein ACTSPB_12610 [Candidatus Thorarchaeota archaeon]
MIEINPTTRIIYWNKELKNLWSERIRKISVAYNTAEFLTFKLGMRRVYVYHVNSERFEDSYELLRDNDLIFYPTNKSGIYQGFSHKHMPVEKGKPFTLYGAVAKRDDKKAGEMFVKYSKSNPVNHKGIGKLLGYPECCLKWFAENWGNPSIDPIYEAALNTKDAEWEVADKLHRETTHMVTVNAHPFCNNMLRYFGIRITPHLTHSMQCKETIKWGEKWFKVMKKVDKEAAKWVWELLSMPLTWNCYKGIAIIDTPIFRGVTNSDGTLTKRIVENKGW